MTDIMELDSNIEVYVPPQGAIRSGTCSPRLERVRSVSLVETILETVEQQPSTTHTSIFPYSLVLKVLTSEPRDVLQLERTCLTFIRFSTALFFTALGIILNFKLDTSGDKQPTDPSDRYKKYHTRFATGMSYALLFFSLIVLIISGVNYFITVLRYAQRKIQTYSFNNFSTMIVMTGIIITLAAINISMLIDEYLQES